MTDFTVYCITVGNTAVRTGISIGTGAGINSGAGTTEGWE
jgi:hypothetical protein